MGVAEGTVPRQRTAVTFGTVAVGIVIGAVEVVFAASFAALVFAGYLEFYFLSDGVGLYLGAAGLTLALMAWREGDRGVVGGLQATAAAVMAIVATSAVVHAGGNPRDIFLTAIAATLVTTVLSGVVMWWLGTRRRGVRRHDRDPLRHLGERGRPRTEPRHQPGAPRRGDGEHRFRRARRDPGLSRA